MLPSNQLPYLSRCTSNYVVDCILLSFNLLALHASDTCCRFGGLKKQWSHLDSQCAIIWVVCLLYRFYSNKRKSATPLTSAARHTYAVATVIVVGRAARRSGRHWTAWWWARHWCWQWHWRWCWYRTARAPLAGAVRNTLAGPAVVVIRRAARYPRWHWSCSWWRRWAHWDWKPSSWTPLAGAVWNALARATIVVVGRASWHLGRSWNHSWWSRGWCWQGRGCWEAWGWRPGSRTVVACAQWHTNTWATVNIALRTVWHLGRSGNQLRNRYIGYIGHVGRIGHVDDNRQIGSVGSIGQVGAIAKWQARPNWRQDWGTRRKSAESWATRWWCAQTASAVHISNWAARDPGWHCRDASEVHQRFISFISIFSPSWSGILMDGSPVNQFHGFLVHWLLRNNLSFPWFFWVH